MKRFSALAAIPILAAATVLGAAGAQAVPLFAVNVTTDQLVRIDSTTGVVSVVGSLGINALDIDLARTADGRLWGLNSNFLSRVDLHEINTTTGAVISSVQVTLGGNGIVSAEGLGNSGNQLNLGYSSAGDANSDSFADLASTGVITNSVVPGIDIDGLAAGAGAVPFYALDREPPISTIIYELDPGIPGTTQIATFPANPVVANDLVRVGSKIFMIDNGSAVLHSFDLATPGTLNTISLSQSGTYLGLAVADPIDAPEPSTLAIFGLGLFGLGAMRRRRKRG